jgi:hypothetical protein
MDEAT